METSHSQKRGHTARVGVGEAAKLLGVTVKTIHRWEEAGYIKASRTPGGQRRFDLAEIERVKRCEPTHETSGVRS